MAVVQSGAQERIVRQLRKSAGRLNMLATQMEVSPDFDIHDHRWVTRLDDVLNPVQLIAQDAHSTKSLDKQTDSS